MERGVQRGELKDNLDIEVVTDLIYGPIFYRLLVVSQPIDDAYVQQLVRYAFEGIR